MATRPNPSATSDVDSDGDLDFLTTVETKEYQVVWYENTYSKRKAGSVVPR